MSKLLQRVGLLGILGSVSPPDVIGSAAGTSLVPLKLSYVAYGYSTAIFTSLVTATVGISLVGRDGSPLLLWLFGQFGFWGAMTSAVILVSRKRGSSSLSQDVGFAFKKSEILPGLALGVACQLLLIPAIYLVLGTVIDTSSVSGPAREVIGELGSGWNIVPLAFGLVVVAPIVEELFFRGFVMRTFIARLGPMFGVMGSAALFGATHFQLLQFVGLFAFGVVLAVLTVRSGRIGLSVFTHMGFNAATTALIIAT